MERERERRVSLGRRFDYTFFICKKPLYQAPEGLRGPKELGKMAALFDPRIATENIDQNMPKQTFSVYLYYL
jgi:hypothetical protein